MLKAIRTKLIGKGIRGASSLYLSNQGETQEPFLPFLLNE